MGVMDYFRVRSLAKRFVELVLLQQALHSIRELTQYDKDVTSALKSLDDETGEAIRSLIDDAMKMGPRAAHAWRDAAKKLIQNTREAELLPHLERVLTSRCGVEFSRSLSKKIPEEFRRRRVDGMVIRLFDLILDKIKMPE